MSPNRPHILFVDDDRSILRAMQFVFRARKEVWDLHFLDGGAKAIEHLQSEDVDVLVTDMRMPEVGGAEVLEFCAESCPNVVRLVHSSTADWDITGPLLSIPHDILDKPCPTGVLVNAVERAIQLSNIPDPQLRAHLAHPTSLPSRPALFAKVSRLLDQGSPLTDVAKIVSEDVAASAKVMQLANSALFSQGRRVESVEDAVQKLGGACVRAIVIASETMRPISGIPEKFVERVNHDSLEIAALASRIAKTEVRNFAFLSGMLRDIGKFIVAAARPKDSQDLITSNDRTYDLEIDGGQTITIEQTVIGAHLLRFWNLPGEVATAVGFRKRPNEAHEFQELVWTLHVAESAYLNKKTDVPDDYKYLVQRADRILSRLAA